MNESAKRVASRYLTAKRLQREKTAATQPLRTRRDYGADSEDEEDENDL